MKYFFCGIGGSGMSSLAQVLLARGHIVAGSDRSINEDDPQPLFRTLASLGVSLHPQDGSGITYDIDYIVISSAIEGRNPDLVAASQIKKIQIKRRAEILAEFFNEYPIRIAVGGTSGKTTTTGMIGHILKSSQIKPTVINGGIMLNELTTNTKGLGNVTLGGDETCVIEADESDGTIDLYQPYLSIVTNISEDHKPLNELETLFEIFANNSQEGIVLNADCETSISLLSRDYEDTLTFGINNDADFKATEITPTGNGYKFKVNEVDAELNIPGKHNIYNALAAITAVSFLGINATQSIEKLAGFTGIKRRMETIGTTENNITVIDDFAHNPEKIAASLTTLGEQIETSGGRIFAIYQPHGFAPTKLTKDKLIETFSACLGEQDALLMPEIYYAGGTAVKDISSINIVNGVKRNGINADFFEKREDIVRCIAGNVRSGDKIIVMGARDNTLANFAQDIFKAVSNHK
ncbi:MAG: UDP-N-acetylmuramate--alanine ligase [Alphaproteobacteria bacterium]|nr:UDP-N-acetylmuramate--alanine ligase [Alphaproteobacteria bacterium]